MKELFIPFNIPEFADMQDELHKAIPHDYTSKLEPYAFTLSERYMIEKCPKFMSWLKPRLKLPVRMYRYYVTPPRRNLGVHIDGPAPDSRVPFALNIPVSGTKNTLHSFYQTDDDNIQRIERELGTSYMEGMMPRSRAKLNLLAEIEIVNPHVTNNAVFHGVTNNTDNYRIMLTIRWNWKDEQGTNVDECIDISDLIEKN